MSQVATGLAETMLRDISYAITYDMSPDNLAGFTGDMTMFSSAWFWMALAGFFIFGPMRWRRGRSNRWIRSDGEGSERRERDLKETRDLAERLERRDEQVEQLEARVAELESRLDFAERLLAPRRDQASLPHIGPA